MASKQKDVTEKLSELLSVIDPKTIVSEKNGIIYIGNERADAGRLANLRAEAEFILASDIWKIINASVQYEAQRVMFSSTETLEELRKGRSMLYTLSIQNSIVTLLKNTIHR